MAIANSEEKIYTLPEETFIRVCGRHSEHLKLIEAEFGVRLVTRGNEIRIARNGMDPAGAYRVLDELTSLAQARKALSLQDVKYIIRTVRQQMIIEPIKTGEEITTIPEPKQIASISDQLTDVIRVPSKRGKVQPRTLGQKKYIDAIRKQDMVFGIGPAGTGKTYLAMAMAVESLMTERVSRIILVRPAVEAGEKLGFLPGDLVEKINPYLRPLYDALYDMMDVHRVQKNLEEGIIEIAPLAFMRGRTLNGAFIILDEAQNTTPEQMKMFLTRLGFDSKTVITGDITQIDLPPGKISGLIQAEQLLKSIKGIEFVYFSGEDVVRHELVQEIIKAYSNLKQNTDNI